MADSQLFASAAEAIDFVICALLAFAQRRFPRLADRTEENLKSRLSSNIERTRPLAAKRRCNGSKSLDQRSPRGAVLIGGTAHLYIHPMQRDVQAASL